ncbi:SDR family oxidoreductase [Amycolatopsis tucumanensis]|uniref:SDR family oxidoreductase n=1 Tax=Amycolatopsis tucumanensis TaxID=401106 RepID=UPI001F159AEA|nr:SDR family oxidoreductase [Amycolatopsis tucumanensis]MCF6423993.1 SDR family oxidoreductase [Amycolatopsis tucumanensis]
MADGAKVAFTYANSRDRAEAVAAATGGAAHPIRADNRREQDIEAAVAATTDRFGGLDILVNNAAVGSFGPTTDPKMDEIDAMLTIDVRSVIVAIREALAHLGEGRRIINIGSPADGPLAPAMLGVMATDQYGTAAEVAAFVSYLTGPEAAYITGSSLNIDGGFTA